MHQSKIIRFKELQKKIGGVSRSTLDRWEKIGHFPKRINLGINSVGWKLEEVEDWISQISLVETNKIMNGKEAFESLPKDVQEHLLNLRNIPGALDRTTNLIKEIEEGKVKIIDSQIVEIN